MFFSTVFEEYRKLSGYEIEESIQKETSGTLQEVLLAVGKTYTHTHTHICQLNMVNLSIKCKIEFSLFYFIILL